MRSRRNFFKMKKCARILNMLLRIEKRKSIFHEITLLSETGPNISMNHIPSNTSFKQKRARQIKLSGLIHLSPRTSKQISEIDTFQDHTDL